MDATPALDRPATRPGALGHWLRQGARSAFLRTPDWSGPPASPAIVAALLTLLLLTLLVERLAIVGPASFYLPAIQSGWLSTLVSAWVCWLLVPRDAPVDPARAPSAAALFALLLAQASTQALVIALVFVPLLHAGLWPAPALGDAGAWLGGLLPLVWIAAGQLRAVWRGGVARRGPRAAAAVLLVGVLLLGEWVQPLRLWYPQPSAGADGTPPLTQAQIESQAEALVRRLDALAAQRPGTVDVYAITFAPHAEEDVFLRESRLVAGVMDERFDAAGRSLQLLNHRSTIGEWPWATPLNLERAIRRAAERMDRDEDVLFLHLTSHGARSGSLAASFWPLQVDEVTPGDLKRWLDDAGVRHRVVSVSACYSGSWIPPLADAGTLVMTAADAEHTSYGCGRGSELTYFGRAVFDEELRRTWSFEAAHAAARTTIERREQEAGKTDGYSNPQIHVGAAVRERLALLEQQRRSAAR
jgi:hypothetical protein